MCGPHRGAASTPPEVTWQVTHPTPIAPRSAGGSLAGSASGAWQPRQNESGSMASARWYAGSVCA